MNNRLENKSDFILTGLCLMVMSLQILQIKETEDILNRTKQIFTLRREIRLAAAGLAKQSGPKDDISLRGEYVNIVAMCETIAEAGYVHGLAGNTAEQAFALRLWRSMVRQDLELVVSLDTTGAPGNWGLKKPRRKVYTMLLPGGIITKGISATISWSPAEVKKDNLRRLEITREIVRLAPQGSLERKHAQHLVKWFESAA